MTQPENPKPPPGWYPSQGGLQWWDGSQWTGPVQPVPPPGVQPPRVAPATVSYVPVQTNHTFHLILTILTCGLWGLFVWLPMTIINQLRKNKVVTRPY